MWYGLSTQAMKDFGDKVGNETRVIDNEERIANHITLAALERAKLMQFKIIGGTLNVRNSAFNIHDLVLHSSIGETNV